MNKISMDKKYRYRNGQPARVLCVDRPESDYPVITLSLDGDVQSHTWKGKYCSSVDREHDLDLIEIKCTVCNDTGIVEELYPDGGHGEFFKEPCKHCELGRQKAAEAAPKKKTFYRRKWIKMTERSLCTDNYWYDQKKDFDFAYQFRKAWSDEWEEIEV